MTEKLPGLRERKKARTRDVLIKSAAVLFRRKGFEGASMEEIAADADVSTPSLYNYFASKDELLAGVLLCDFADGMEQANGVLDRPPSDAVTAFCELTRVHFDNFDRIDRALLRRFTAHAISQRNATTAAYLGAESDLRRQLTELSAALRAIGAIDGAMDPVAVGDLVFSIANSEYYLYVADDAMSWKDVVKRVRSQLEIIF